MKKRILVTGASGFIGGYVAQEARRRGHHVRGLDRCASRAEGVEVVVADIRDRDRMGQVMEGIDHVIHLAAITSNVEFMKNPTDCYDINVNGFLSVMDAAVKRGCKGIVYASSAAVYVDGFSEGIAIDFNAQRNHYAKTKMMNEMVAKSYEDIYGIRTTGLRFFNVYGIGENEKGDYASIVALFMKAKRKGEALVVYGDGTQARDLVHVTDAARITLDALERGSRQLYNVGTGIATPYRVIAEMIDGHRIRCVPNPLPSYQRYTRAETSRVREISGGCALTSVPEGIAEMARASYFPAQKWPGKWLISRNPQERERAQAPNAGGTAPGGCSDPENS